MFIMHYESFFMTGEKQAAQNAHFYPGDKVVQPENALSYGAIVCLDL